jgi:hypothetical protein
MDASKRRDKLLNEAFKVLGDEEMPKLYDAAILREFYYDDLADYYASLAQEDNLPFAAVLASYYGARVGYTPQAAAIVKSTERDDSTQPLNHGRLLLLKNEEE